jgi:hypothetical protein
MRAFLSTLLVLIHSLSICVPQSAFGKSKINCQPDGESIIVTSAQEKPDWINKPHSADARYENFTGLSTQNEKLENGKKLALKEAKTSLLDAIGELIQTQNNE